MCESCLLLQQASGLSSFERLFTESEQIKRTNRALQTHNNTMRREQMVCAVEQLWTTTVDLKN
jgi:hypothetical protein